MDCLMAVCLCTLISNLVRLRETRLLCVPLWQEGFLVEFTHIL